MAKERIEVEVAYARPERQLILKVQGPVGMTVAEQDGTILGQVSEIISTGANDVYVVVGPEGQLLLPAIESVILEIDLNADRMVVHVLEGLR